MKHIYLPFLAIVMFFNNSTQVFAQLEYLPEIRTEIYDSSALGEGKIFLSNYREMGVNFQTDPDFHSAAMVLNNDGTPYFSKDIGPTKGTGLVDFKMHPNGMMSYPRVLYNYLWTGGGSVIHMVMDKDFNVVDSFQMGGGYVAETHDFRILPNGHTLLMGYYLVPIDLSKVVPGGRPNALVDGAVIQELDENKNVVFQWRTWDYFSLKMIPWPMVQGNTQQIINVFHLNTLSMDHDGNLLLGTPAMGMKVSRQTGAIMWMIGGGFNQFKFENVDSLQAIGDFGGHTFHRIDNGNILVYDNSPFPWQPGANVISAEAAEYSIDEVNRKAKLEWKYTPSQMIPGWHAGSVQRLTNGNTVIGWGGPPADSTSLVYSEVTKAGDRVMDVFFEGDRVESYRAFRFPLDTGIPTSEVTLGEVAPGNTYSFSQGDTIETGISVKINTYSGGGYNEFTVKKFNFAPKYPSFPGKAPWVIPARIVTSGFNITNLDAQISFDVTEWDIKKPENAVIYFREFEVKNGLFVPLVTDYNNVTGQVRADINKFGEYILGYPDLESKLIRPVLSLPVDLARVNQNTPVVLSWIPKGYVNDYTLQVAKDMNFENIILQQEYLKQSIFQMTPEANTDYYWRVKSFNDVGETNWSDTLMFTTTEPYLQVISPNGNEVLKRGLEHYINWKGNIKHDVKLELYHNKELVKVIDTLTTDFPDNMYYKWEFPTSLDSTCGYYIKVTSMADSTVFDHSDFTFAVNDSACTNTEVSYRTIDITSPTLGEIWITGESYTINWINNFEDAVKIELMQGQNIIMEIAVTTSIGVNWTIPTGITPAADYTIRVSSVEDPSVVSLSETFEIDNTVSVLSKEYNHNLEVSPNPTNGIIRIEYSLQDNQQVRASVYTLAGSEVKQLCSEFQNTGKYSRTFSLTDLPKGIYFIQLSFNSKKINKKLVLQ